MMGGSRKGPLSDEVLETPFGAETTPVWPGKDNNYFALFGNTNALRSALGLEPIPSKHARKPSQTLLVFNPGMKPKANSGIMETILDKCGILTDKVRALPQGGDKRARAVARLVMGKLKPPPSNGLWNLTGGPQPHILTFKNFYNNSCKARHIKTVRDYLSFFHVDPTWESVLNHVSPRPSAQPSSGGADPAVGAKRARTAAPGASGGGGDEEEEEASDESEIPAWAKKRQRSKTRQTEQTEQVERSLSEDLRFQTAGIAAAVRLAKDGISNIERLLAESESEDEESGGPDSQANGSSTDTDTDTDSCPPAAAAVRATKDNPTNNATASTSTGRTAKNDPSPEALLDVQLSTALLLGTKKAERVAAARLIKEAIRLSAAISRRTAGEEEKWSEEGRVHDSVDNALVGGRGAHGTPVYKCIQKLVDDEAQGWEEGGWGGAAVAAGLRAAVGRGTMAECGSKN